MATAVPLENTRRVGSSGVGVNPLLTLRGESTFGDNGCALAARTAPRTGKRSVAMMCGTSTCSATGPVHCPVFVANWNCARRMIFFVFYSFLRVSDNLKIGFILRLTTFAKLNVVQLQLDFYQRLPSSS